MSNPETAHELCPIFLRLPPEHIGYLKFLIEGYEGLAIVRTLEPEHGSIVVLALPDTHAEVIKLLQSLSDKLKLIFTDTPDNLEGDWLLADAVDWRAS